MNLEVLSPAQATEADLSAYAQRINESIELLKGHEAAFEDATLEHRLIIGLEIAKAQAAFGISKAQAGAIGGSKPTVGMLGSNPLGFSNWLAKEIPDLKRSTAQRYSTAFAALGVSVDEATPRVIRERLKKIRHDAGKANLPAPTLAALYKQGKPAPVKGPLLIDAPTKSAQTRLEDAREHWFTWEEDGRKLVTGGFMDDLDKRGLEVLREFNLWMRDQINNRLKS